ncbi:MAG: hypothetical protein N2Z23_04690 [Pyrinomonadaceae bacterium]|nr:hypothetical protein [Pyrinomonadaceae bacterium]MCX7639721.1 hypothetical protein [Pyrinomonadaceae bacterium]MDW8304304.1 SdrD B-like domain-containing protein [Acidobacteriota bacterium]
MNSRKIVFSTFALVALISLAIVFSLLSKDTVIAAGNISGRVFLDYNSNGLYDTSIGLTSIDRGVGGVTVEVYDSSGTLRGSAITASDGTYSISATGVGPYRVEFKAIPIGYQPGPRSRSSVGGGSSSNAGSTVQFVPDGNTSNVNLALVRPEDYCQDLPTLVTPRLLEGASNGAYRNSSLLIDFPYNAGTIYTDTNISNYDNPTTRSLTVRFQQIGTVLSMAYSKRRNRLYVASYFKRHAGFGPGADGVLNNADDPGAIYVINPSNNTVTNVFTVPNATLNRHDVNNYGDDNLDLGWDAVGKTSLGGIALSDDEASLFVVNLENRRLYRLDAVSGTNQGSVDLTSVTLPTPGGTSSNCNNNDERPFALRFYRGNLYVGYVCSAETSQNASDLFAYIFQVNPISLTISSAPTFQFRLNYPRRNADPGWPAAWRPWRTTISSDFAYPQPMFTDIEFQDDNLIIGLRDRAGDQAMDEGPNAKRTAGDTLRACGSFGAWTLESNGRCGGTGNAPQGTNQGPGGGEFYYQDDFVLYHDEVSWGTFLQIPGRRHLLNTLLDPIDSNIFPGGTFDGGLRWFNNSTGASDRAYRIYNGGGTPDFGKVNGLGDVVAMCAPAPIEIGNRVWRDNGDGIQQPTEPPIAGVTVRLYDSAGNLIATAVTDSNGEFYFSSAPGTNTPNAIYGLNLQPNTQYQIRFDNPANYASGGPLHNFILTQSNAGGNSSIDSNATYVTNPAGSPAGTWPVITFTTGDYGHNNHTFDTGFRLNPTADSVNVGGRVLDSRGRGIGNVFVSLIEQNGNIRMTRTNFFGYYVFPEVEVGQVITVSVSSKRHSFAQPNRVINLTHEMMNINFIAEDPFTSKEEGFYSIRKNSRHNSRHTRNL